MDTKLQIEIEQRQKRINTEVAGLAEAAFTLGAYSAEDKLVEIFATLKANLHNDKLSDAEFREITGQFLDRLTKLVDERK